VPELGHSEEDARYTRWNAMPATVDDDDEKQDKNHKQG
jgi:hypothetical protein